MSDLTTQTTLPTGTWQLDTSASAITVTAKKLKFFTVPAELSVTAGHIEIDAEHRVVAVEIVADAASYASRNAKRNEHVVGSDFLDATTHPTITFRTDDVISTGTDHRARGTVTVKGAVFPVDVAVTDVQFDEQRGSFTASAVVDRTAIGVGTMPTFVIGRDVQIVVSVTATKTP